MAGGYSARARRGADQWASACVFLQVEEAQNEQRGASSGEVAGMWSDEISRGVDRWN